MQTAQSEGPPEHCGVAGEGKQKGQRGFFQQHDAAASLLRAYRAWPRDTEMKLAWGETLGRTKY